MPRLLTGYAIRSNHPDHRHGHLWQNRLDRYPRCGHAVLVGRVMREGQGGSRHEQVSRVLSEQVQHCVTTLGLALAEAARRLRVLPGVPARARRKGEVHGVEYVPDDGLGGTARRAPDTLHKWPTSPSTASTGARPAIKGSRE